MRHHGCDRPADRFGHYARRAMKAAMASGGWNPFYDGPPPPPGMPGFGFGGGRGGGRGRRRMFDGAQLRLLLLKLIADEPRHGYSLIKAIEELSGGDYAPSPGVVYPTLNLMVDEGLVAQADEEGGRRQPSGKDHERGHTVGADAGLEQLPGDIRRDVAQVEVRRPVLGVAPLPYLRRLCHLAQLSDGIRPAVGIRIRHATSPTGCAGRATAPRNPR